MENINILLIDKSGLQLPVDAIHLQTPEQIAATLKQNTVDVVLIDAELAPHIEAIRSHAPKVPIIVLIDESSRYFAVRAGREKILNFLIKESITCRLLMETIQYLVEHAQQEAAYEHTSERFQRIIEDHKQLRRIDRELGYTLNLDHILNLAMDTALRLTAASGVVIGWLNEETGFLEKLASIGMQQMLSSPIPTYEWQNSATVIRVFEQVRAGDLKVHLIMPLVAQNEFTGVMGLENIPAPFCCDQTDLDFLTHLSSRTAAALEKTQIYQRTRHQAIQMDKLYVLSNDIAHHLKRDEIMEASAASMAVLLDGSSAFFCEYDAEVMVVRSSFVVEGMLDAPVPIQTPIKLADYPLLFRSLFDDPIQISQTDLHLTSEQEAFLRNLDVHSVLVVPLIDGDVLLGMIVLCESRYERYFTTDEIALARSLAGSVTVALKKATLFAEVQELEQLKSEMIRMASHDLRAPLSRIVFSLAMLETPPEQDNLVKAIEDAAEQMKVLLEDILNLERLESEESTQWQIIDGIELVQKVSDGFKHEVDLNGQAYQLELPSEGALLYGSEIQLQQALSNFISNALKYTPRGGAITTRVWVENGRFMFEVEDNGYGIPQDRQEKIFSRFYRARTPGTETIPGTGLGLSLVKTVIQRHGGGVWFRSEINTGSVFGCWLPMKPKEA